MMDEVRRTELPCDRPPDARHTRFEREAALDRWVQGRGDALAHAYETHSDAQVLLSFAVSSWARERHDAPDVEHGVASIAASVAASARSNLEPACSRLLWATRRGRTDGDALEAAQHYATLAFATAKRAADRDAAECVSSAVRFVRAGRRNALDDRDAALERLAMLAERRLPNLASLIGAHFPFWSFPFAFRWGEDAPRFGRGRLGLPDPCSDEDLGGLLSLAYRSGRTRAEISEALERCACASRRIAPGGLEQARATSTISELARDLRDTWVLRDASSPSDLTERVAPRTLALPFLRGPGDVERAQRRASFVLCPVLLAHWPELAEIGAAHRGFRSERATRIAA